VPDFNNDLLGFAQESKCLALVFKMITDEEEESSDPHAPYVPPKAEQRKREALATMAFETHVIFGVIAPAQVEFVVGAPIQNQLHDLHSRCSSAWLNAWMSKAHQKDHNLANYMVSAVNLAMSRPARKKALASDLAQRLAAIKAADESKAIARSVDKVSLSAKPAKTQRI
jgi:hypothetical protein